MSDELLTHTAYAKRIGRSQPYVSKLVKNGRIPTVDGLINPTAADAALAQSVSPSRVAEEANRRAQRKAQAAAAASGAAAKPTGQPAADRAPTDTSSYTFARTERERALAKQAQLDYRRSVGELCEVQSVDKAVGDCAVATRRLVEQIPNRIANQLAAALGVDVRKVQPIMQMEIERICDAIADTARALPEQVGATRQ